MQLIRRNPVLAFLALSVCLTSAARVQSQDEPATPEPVLRLGSESRVHSLRFLPGDEELVRVKSDGTVTVWNLETREPTRQFQVTGKPAALSPDGTRLAEIHLSSDPNHESRRLLFPVVGLWNLNTGKLEKEMDPVTYPDNLSEIPSVVFAPDPPEIVFTTGWFYEAELLILNPDDDPTSRRIFDGIPGKSPDTNGIAQVAVSPDGELVAATYLRHGIMGLWGTKDGKLRRTIPDAPTGDPVFTGDGLHLVGVVERELRLWSTATGEVDQNLPTEIEPRPQDRSISTVRSPSGKFLAVAGRNFELWDLTGRKRVLSLPAEARITAVCFSNNELAFATGHTDGTVSVWAIP